MIHLFLSHTNLLPLTVESILIYLVGSVVSCLKI